MTPLRFNVLELVQLVLPAPVELESHLDATEDHLLAPFKVDAQLHDVSVIDREWLRLLTGRAQSNVIQKGAAAALDVFNVPFAIFVPKLAMSAAHHLGFESDWCRGRYVGWNGRLIVSLRVATDADDVGAGWQSARDWGEVERGSLASGVEKDRESY